MSAMSFDHSDHICASETVQGHPVHGERDLCYDSGSKSDSQEICFKPESEASPNHHHLSIVSGDQITYRGKSWTMKGYNVRNGDLILGRDGYRLINWHEVLQLNPGRQLKDGDRYRIKRTNGDLEDGWKLILARADGWLQMFKEGARQIEVSRTEIVRSNPQLVRRDVPVQPEPSAE